MFARSGGTNVRVYGSVARREETEQSDIDFLIALTPEKLSRPFVIQQALVAEMRQDLEQLLNREVHIHVEEWLERQARKAILQSTLVQL